MQVLRSDNNLRNPDVELQQRAIEYLQLSTVASADVLVGLWVFCEGSIWKGFFGGVEGVYMSFDSIMIHLTFSFLWVHFFF